MRHGLTLGELGLWFVSMLKLDVEYRVIEMQDWQPRCRAGVRLAAGRAHVDQSQSQRAELVDGARLCRDSDDRGHDALGRTRHHSAARTVRRSRYRCAGGHEGNGRPCSAVARWLPPARVSGSNLRFTNMWASFATACRFTPKVPATITKRSGPGASRRSPSRRFAGCIRTIRCGAISPTSTSIGKLAIDVINGGPLLREWVDDAVGDAAGPGCARHSG